MYFHLHDIRRINNQHNWTDSELSRHSSRWKGNTLYGHHYWRNERIKRRLEIEEHRSAPIVPGIVSDSDSDSKSDSDSDSNSASVITIGSSTSSRLSSISVAPILIIDNEPKEHPSITLSRLWNLENSRIQRAWKQRAEQLNKIKIPGLVNEIPRPIELKNKKEIICITLQNNWNICCKKFLRALQSKQSKHSMKVLQLGQERVMYAKKAYVTLYVTPLLIEALFGKKYSLVPHETIVYQSKHMIVIHFFSVEHLNQILQLAGDCPGSVHKSDKTFQLAGKVEYTENGEDKTGYILHESTTHYQVIRLDQSIFNIRKPTYTLDRLSYHENGEVLCYDLSQSLEVVAENDDMSAQPSYYLGNQHGIELTWIYPVRILVTKNGKNNFRLLGNYYVRGDDGAIDELLSSCELNIFLYCVLLKHYHERIGQIIAVKLKYRYYICCYKNVWRSFCFLCFCVPCLAWKIYQFQVHICYMFVSLLELGILLERGNKNFLSFLPSYHCHLLLNKLYILQLS